MTLSETLRPSSLSGLIGQPSAVSLLEPHLNGGQRRTSYLISGSSGTGKTTIAEIIAKHWNPEEEPIRLNAADQNGVAFIRGLIEKLHYSSLSGLPQIYILNEAQRLTAEAQDCLLDPLEQDLPSTLILTTTEPDAIKTPLRDRCLWVKLNGMTSEARGQLAHRAFTTLGIDSNIGQIIEAIEEAGLTSARAVYNAIESWKAGLSPEQAVLSPEAEPQYREIASLVVQGNWLKLKPLLKKLNPSDAKPLRTVISGWMRSFLLTNPGNCGTIIADHLRQLALYSAFEAGVDLSGLVAVVYSFCQKIGEKK